MPGLLRVRMGGPASPRFSRPARLELRVFGARSGGCLRRGRGAAGACLWRQSEDGLAVRRFLDAQGGAGDSGAAAVAPGSGGGIGPAAERAGDLLDGALSGL